MGVGGSSGHISPDIGRGINVSDSTGTTRVQLGQISDPSETHPRGDYGLKVTSSDGETVIIDGTSNMFKIVASGTQSVAFPASVGASSDTFVVIPDVTSGDVVLAVISQVASSNAAAAPRHEASVWVFDSPDWAMALGMDTGHNSTNGTDMVVQLNAYAGTRNTTGYTAYQRYYLLKEVSL